MAEPHQSELLEPAQPALEQLRRERDEARRERDRAIAQLTAHQLEPQGTLLERLIAQMTDGFAFIDRELVFQRVNPAYARIFGRTPQEIEGLPVFELFPGTEDQVGPLLRGVLDTGEPIGANSFPFSFTSETGCRQTYWDFTYSPVRDDAGQIIGLLAVCAEVTPRALMEQEAERQARELARQKELTERLVTNAPAGISYLSRDLVYQWANPAQFAMWNLSPEDVLGKSLGEVFGPEADEQAGHLLRQVIETGEPYSASGFPFRYTCQGQERLTYWDFSYRPVRDAQGDIEGVLVMATEVSERLQAEKALRASQTKYKRLFQASIDAIVVADEQRRMRDLNPAFLAMFGYRAEELVGCTTNVLYPDPSQFDRVGRQLTERPEQSEPLVLELTFRRKNGELFPVEMSSYVLRDDEGRIQHHVGVVRDLTDQKRIEAAAAAHNEELIRQKAFAESLIQNVATGIAYLDHDLVFRVANPVYSSMLQLRPEDILHRHVFDVFPGGEAQIEHLLRAVLETGEAHYEREFRFTYVLPDGQERTTYWDFVYYPLIHPGATRPEGIFVLAGEISDRIEQQREQRRMKEEQERLQQDRIEALEQADRLKDQFLSILSHELRTPINAITGFGSVLDDEVLGPLTDEQHHYLQKMLAGADKLLLLIEDLLDMSRIEAGKFTVSPAPMRLPTVVDDVLGQLAPLAAQNGQHLVNEVPADLPLLPADVHRIGQVLSNLVVNGLKFMPAGGTVRVRARVEGGELRCEVEDTGMGIAPEDLPRLFQRFTQLDMGPTRSAGGTGLGLSICKGILTAHGGRIGVTSEPGVGSTFWFSLPLGS